MTADARGSLYLGIDVGTSGVRTSIINADGERLSSASCPMPAPGLLDGRPAQDPAIWRTAVEECLRRQSAALRGAGASMADIATLAVDGTSGTMLLADARLRPVTPGLMYNSSGFDREAEQIARHAPLPSIARGPASALARLLRLQTMDRGERAVFAMHQADWIVAGLTGEGGCSDESNVLKLGYDLDARKWPDWFADCGVRMSLLPQVRPVGEHFARIGETAIRAFGFSDDVRVCAGATDSVAAFLASGASRVGDAVTSLGSTLAIKLMSDRPVCDPPRGVYSHRVGEAWLAGGASNTGGAVLRRYFGDGEIAALSEQIDPSQPSGLDYYPLLRPGERFPVNDPGLQPRLSPRPSDPIAFLHGMLEGMAKIEADGYRVLESLGCPHPARVFTAGGGAVNEVWSHIRERFLATSVLRSPCDDAATGAARIAAGLFFRKW